MKFGSETMESFILGSKNGEVQQSGEFGKQNKAGTFMGFLSVRLSLCIFSMLMCPGSPGEGHCGQQSPNLLVLGNVF